MSQPDLSSEQKIEEIYRLTVENNHILHKIQNRDRIALTLRIIYWLAILGILGGAFYYIRPFFEAIVGTGSGTSNILDQFEMLRSELPETRALQEFFNQMSQGEPAQPAMSQE